VNEGKVGNKKDILLPIELEKEKSIIRLSDGVYIKTKKQSVRIKTDSYAVLSETIARLTKKREFTLRRELISIQDIRADIKLLFNSKIEVIRNGAENLDRMLEEISWEDTPYQLPITQQELFDKVMLSRSDNLEVTADAVAKLYQQIQDECLSMMPIKRDEYYNELMGRIISNLKKPIGTNCTYCSNSLVQTSNAIGHAGYFSRGYCLKCGKSFQIKEGEIKEVKELKKIIFRDILI
jgi:hypothetical protein